MSLLRTLTVASAMLALACGNPEMTINEDGESDPLATSEGTVIVGSLNWTSTTSLAAQSGEAKNARAVGYLSIPAKNSRCTAWLINANTIITNHHCVANAGEAVGAKVSFNYVDGVTSSSRIWYSCATFVKAWSDVDMAVLRCSARNGVNPGAVYGTLALASSDVPDNATVYVVHQNCDYEKTPGCVPTKKHSPGTVLDNTYGTRDVSYNADTLAGSSGSPVFAKYGTGRSHKVVALHHFGYNGNADGRGTHNSGVRVSAIKAKLAEIGL